MPAQALQFLFILHYVVRALMTLRLKNNKKFTFDLYIDGHKIGCFALTEPNAGSDASGLQTSAVLENGEYLINGSRVFTTNSGFANAFIVFAVTDKAMGNDGISAFIY